MLSRLGSKASQPWRVLVAGGSYAGLAAALNLLDLCEGRPPRFNPGLERSPSLRYRVPIEVTIVDERDGYYHLIGSPLALAKEDYAAKAWVKFHDVKALQHPSIEIVHGSMQSVDSDNLTATISEHGTGNVRTLSYDYLIAATGLRRHWPVVPQSLTRAAYLQEAQANIDATKNSPYGVVVIGGGAVGVEMAAELKMVQPDTKVTLIHSRDQLLSAEPLPDEFKDAVAPLVRESGVELVLGQRVVDIDASESSAQKLTLADGTIMLASVVLKAISAPVPTTAYLPRSSLDIEGYVKIAHTLHFTADSTARRHLAVGDIALWSGIKRCGGAMHMGHFAAFNIHQDMIAILNPGYEPKYMSLAEFPPVIGLAVGKKAISYGSTEGVKQGQDVLRLMFGNDLGWSICWNYLRLGEKNPEAVEDTDQEMQFSGVDEKEMLQGKISVEVVSVV